LEPGFSEFQVQASRRAANLATIRQYRSTLQSDTSQARPRAAFLLAEIYYFQMDKVDSALMQYQAVERTFPASPYAPKSAFARLWIETHDRGDTLGAAALTDSIVSHYGKTRYAESALYLWRRWSGRTDARSALLDSMLAHPDTTLARERAAEGLLEPPLLGAPPDTLKTPHVIATPITPAEEARRDSLAAYTRALYRAQRLGQPPPPPPPPIVPHPADADTSQTKPPPSRPAPGDTTSTPVIGPSR
jgi:hypothetical protein